MFNDPEPHTREVPPTPAHPDTKAKVLVQCPPSFNAGLEWARFPFQRAEAEVQSLQQAQDPIVIQQDCIYFSVTLDRGQGTAIIRLPNFLWQWILAQKGETDFTE